MNIYRNLLIGIFIISLSACSAQNQVYSNLVQRKQTEDAAWSRVVPILQVQCGYSTTEKPAPEQAVNLSRCTTQVINENIMPYAAFPAALVEMRARAQANAERYANGQITGQQYEEYTDLNVKMYKDQQQAMADSLMLSAAQRDQTLSILAGGVAQGARNASEQQREAYRQQQANRPIQTTCSQDYYGDINCTSY